ncbi:MAG: CinA family protein [SAR202 cluster bacterium]|jgi:PncC family amidohydrolase|nr:CinA family protein [SAR202 cluster bacterium]|tara:strand:+ start:1410 stop:1898 length:489 start_codon:yes stop_codon:yes gene_type:complete
MNPEIMSLAEKAGTILRDKGETVGIAESSSGGLISAHLLAIAGASAYFLGGSVIYTRYAGRGLLGVTDDEMEGMRAATESYASLNAGRISEILGSTWGLSETGATGPDGNRYGDDAGHSCIAVSGPVSRSRTIETGSNDRQENMIAFSIAALELLIECLQSE